MRSPCCARPAALALLRPRRQRPRHPHAAEQRVELAPFRRSAPPVLSIEVIGDGEADALEALARLVFDIV